MFLNKTQMMSACVVRVVLFVGVSLLTASAQEVSAIDSTLRAIEQLYEGGSFTAAELESRRMLEQSVLSDSVRQECDRWIAYSLVAQNRTSAAVERFVIMLRRDAAYQPDPLLTSPKILAVFEQARSRFAEEQRTDRVIPSLTDSPSTRSVTFRTVVFPGWEQLHQGRETTGYLFLAAGAATLVSTIAFDVQRRDARQSYLSATTPQSAQERYTTYNRAHKAEIYSALAFAAVYIASQVDVFIDLSIATAPTSSVQLHPTHTRLTLALRL